MVELLEWMECIEDKRQAKAVKEKSNEITAIPELLDKIQIKGQVVTIDAMGTQTAIAEKVRKKAQPFQIL